MDIKFTPPRLSGTPEERLRQLNLWLATFLQSLNIMLEGLEIEIDKIKRGDGK
jgi:hypothetical protein